MNLFEVLLFALIIFFSLAGEAFKLPIDNAIGFHTNAAEFLFQPEVVKDRQDQRTSC